MLPEIGHFLLIIAASLTPILFFYSFKADRNDNLLILRFIIIISFLIICAYISIVISFVGDDFSLLIAYKHSHSLMPLKYKLSATYSNHEGSLLLAVIFISIYSTILSSHLKTIEKASNDYYKIISKAVGILSVIIFVFLAYILVASNPFARVTGNIDEGSGLNPLLQDPLVILHPPTLYLGYTATALIFALSISVLLSNKKEIKSWYKLDGQRIILKWTIVAWTFMIAGLSLGGIWSYYELGWGGYWFWDPVENSAFFTFLITTALIHIAIVTERRKTFYALSFLIGISTFCFSLFSMFIVRSGVLESVHNFSLDPIRGILLFGMFAITTFIGIFIFSLRYQNVVVEKHFNFLSRETLILYGSAMIIASSLVIIFGTIYPLMLEYFFDTRISVGAIWFEKMNSPLFAIIVLTAVIAPNIGWHRGVIKFNKFAFVTSIALFLLLAILLIYKIYVTKDFQLLYIFLAIFASTVLLYELLTSWQRNKSNILTNIQRHLGHLGLIVWLAVLPFANIYSIDFSSDFVTGQTKIMGKYKVSYLKQSNVQVSNYTANKVYIMLVDSKDNKEKKFELERRSYQPNDTETTESKIVAGIFNDLILSFAKLSDDKITISLRYRPLTLFVWLGALLFCLAGIFSLKNLKPSRKDIKEKSMNDEKVS